MSAPMRVVIVGAGAAGDAAAMTLRKHGFDGEVTLVGAEELLPYERPLLSKQFLRSERDFDRLFLRPQGEYERQGITLITGRSVTSASTSAQTVSLDDGREIGYDILVLATGSTPRWLPEIPRVANVHSLRTVGDAIAIKDSLAESKSILLLGAGFIGAEVAASARTMGKRVLIVELAAVPMGRALGTQVGEWYGQLHRSHGVDLRTSTSVTDWITSEGRLKKVELSDGSLHDVDLAVVGLGVSPRMELPQELALPVGNGGVLVDECLRVTPTIYAAGDIASHFHPVFHRHVRVEHWQVAQRQGSGVAASIALGPRPYEELPWFWSDQYDVNMQYVGNAQKSEHPVFRGDPDSGKFSVFYLQGNVVEAVLSINDGRTGRFSRPLISGKIPVSPDILADPDTDIRDLSTARD